MSVVHSECPGNAGKQPGWQCGAGPADFRGSWPSLFFPPRICPENPMEQMTMIHLIGDREYLQVYHVTPKRNRDRIEAVGLQVKRSQGALQVIWFCQQSAINWAIRHLAIHHGVDQVDMHIFQVILPRWLFTPRGRGCFLCHNDIPNWALSTAVNC